MSPRERRQTSRISAEETPWKPDALLRPGQQVRLLNLSGGGALLESSSRMSPGTRTELHLLSGPRRRVVRGRIERCRVASLNPVRYQGAIVFEQPLEWPGAEMDACCE